jgi:hypothetical protein
MYHDRKDPDDKEIPYRNHQIMPVNIVQQPPPKPQSHSEGKMPPQPLILTLRLDKATEKIMTDLRRKYFPKHRNFLSAHVTLFHALPAVHKPIYNHILSSVTSSMAPFTVGIKDVFPLGNKGVGLNVSSIKLRHLRDVLLASFREEGIELTEQDQRRLRAHITIQNKVGEEEARRTLDEVKKSWVDRGAKAEGIVVWRYEVGGEWTRLEEHEFRGNN